jgi:nucleoporin NUP159
MILASAVCLLSGCQSGGRSSGWASWWPWSKKDTATSVASSAPKSNFPPPEKPSAGVTPATLAQQQSPGASASGSTAVHNDYAQSGPYSAGAYGQLPYQPASYGQTGHSATAYGQTGYGPTSYGQSPYGQTAYGQTGDAATGYGAATSPYADPYAQSGTYGAYGSNGAYNNGQAAAGSVSPYGTSPGYGGAVQAGGYSATGYPDPYGSYNTGAGSTASSAYGPDYRTADTRGTDPYAAGSNSYPGSVTGSAGYPASPYASGTPGYGAPAPAGSVPAAGDPTGGAYYLQGSPSGGSTTGDRYQNWQGSQYGTGTTQANVATGPSAYTGQTGYQPGNTGYQPGQMSGQQFHGTSAYQSPYGAYGSTQTAGGTAYTPGSTTTDIPSGSSLYGTSTGVTSAGQSPPPSGTASSPSSGTFLR